MMSRKLFISALWGISIILCIFTGCRTNSSRSEEYFGEETVWDILHRGDSDRAREYFMGSVDVNDTDMEGRTPLHLAAEIEDPALASFFVALGAHVDIEDDEGRTPLDISSTIRDGETAKILIAAGANIYHPMEGGGSPATTAVRDETFLAAILGPESIGSLNQEGQTILHIAADEGAARAVDAIVAAGAQVDARDNQGRTPLDLAYSHPRSRGHAETAEHLILAGGSSSNPFNPYFTLAVRNSNFNLRNSDSMTPTHYAARQDYMGFLEFMLDRDADPNIKNASGITPLLEAVRAGNAEAVKLLLDRGALVDVQDARGNSVLHIALNAVNYQETLPLLLSYGAKPNFRDDNGDSPLHRAILLNRQPETISGLLAGGADVSLRNRSGKTPLFLAVQQNQANVIPLLLAYKSDIFASDNSGQSPFEKALADRSFVLASLITPETVLLANSQGDNLLHIAVKNRADLGIIGLALDYKAPVNARNKEGETPLHIAVRLDEGEIGELLLSRGADIFAPNGKGESSLYLAFFPVNGRPATQSTLRRWMLNPPALDARDGLGNTPLHYVAQWKLDTFIPLMVQMGANTEAVNATGETSLFAAVKQDSPSTIQALFAAGASANARDTLGNTAIHAAVRWNAQNAAQSLISKGMDINSHALNGKTPLHDAVRLGIVNLETLLIRSGAQLGTMREIPPSWRPSWRGYPPLWKGSWAGAPIPGPGTSGGIRRSISPWPPRGAIW